MLKKRYPDGFEDDIIRINNAKNEPIFVVPLDTDDTNYLIKIAVVKNSDGEYDIDVDEEPVENDDESEYSADDDLDFDD